MLGWFFASPGKLILIPDESGKTYSGFYSGNPLTLTAKPNDTIETVMTNFNAYRSPDQQILQLWDSSGEIIPFSTSLNGVTIQATVRRGYPV